MQLAREWEEQEQCRIENQPITVFKEVYDKVMEAYDPMQPTELELLQNFFTTEELITELRRRGVIIHILGEDHASTSSPT